VFRNTKLWLESSPAVTSVFSKGTGVGFEQTHALKDNGGCISMRNYGRARWRGFTTG